MVTSRSGHRARMPIFAALALAIMALVGVANGSARSLAGPTVAAEPTISGPAVVGGELHRKSRALAEHERHHVLVPVAPVQEDPPDDSSSATCQNIGGETDVTYTVRSDDLGKRIRFRVKAKNSAGSTTATSAPTSVVVQPNDKPASTFPPVISGSALVGQTLKTTTGSWTGDQPITYSYKWQRCDKEGNACKAIDGATEASYKLKQADFDKTLRTRVIAKNARGQGDAYSPQTSVVQDANSGIITLPDGAKSIDVKDVPKGERLIVDQVKFSPNPLTSTSQNVLAQIKVKSTQGYVVRGAIVFIRATPRVVDGGDNSSTSTEGWVQYSMPPTSDMKHMKPFQNLQFFVKAYRKGDPELAGIAGYRLVQVGLNF